MNPKHEISSINTKNIFQTLKNLFSGSKIGIYLFKAFYIVIISSLTFFFWWLLKLKLNYEQKNKIK